MSKFLEKTKEIITGRTSPITKEEAKMIAITGGNCTVEQRIKNFILEINNIIEEKARFSRFYCLVELPSDLVDVKETIAQEYINRGFTIYNLNPDCLSVFVISWK